jgi:RNA polymerase sigma factor for flagellar operon FliA
MEATMQAQQAPKATYDRDAEVRRCTGLVWKIARQVAAKVPASVEVDDLVQAGMVGLVEASMRYEPASGVPFEGFAVQRIRGAITDELRTNDWLPRGRRREQRRIQEATTRLSHLLGRAPTQTELARELDIDLETLQDHISGSDQARPLNCEADDESDEEAFLESRFADGAPDPCESLIDRRFKKDLAAAVAKLPERERLVMGLYYEQELNLREIAAVIGVTESRVCQIHKQAVQGLQRALGDWRGEASRRAA